MILVDNEFLYIDCDVEPVVEARTILPGMDKKTAKAVRKKPFRTVVNVHYHIVYQQRQYYIFIQQDYVWDGATIPFGFRWILGGKGNSAFLIPSSVHDKMCENKHLVDYDRYLSSLIFRELLKACGCSDFKAQIMFTAVETFQKLQKGWKKVREEDAGNQ